MDYLPIEQKQGGEMYSFDEIIKYSGIISDYHNMEIKLKELDSQIKNLTIENNNLKSYLNNSELAETKKIFHLLQKWKKYNVFKESNHLSLNFKRNKRFRRQLVNHDEFEKDLRERFKDELSNSSKIFNDIMEDFFSYFYWDLWDKYNYRDYIIDLKIEILDLKKENKNYDSKNRFLEKKLLDFKKEYRPITRIEIIGAEDYISRKDPEYSKFKKDVLIRDNNLCQCCGSKEDPEVHHKYAMNKHNSLGATISNGIVLCEKCHKEYHHQYGWKENCNPITLKKFIRKYWNQSPLNEDNQIPENMHLKEMITKLEKIISEKDAEIKRLSDIEYMKSKIEKYEFNHSKEKKIEDLKVKEYDKKYENSNVFDLVKKGVF